MAVQIFVDAAVSIAVIVECLIVGIIVVISFSPSTVSISAQMHIRRYFGSIDEKGGGDGSSTSLLGRRVVFPASEAVYGPYIFDAISMSCDRTGQSRITLLSTAHLYCLVEGNDKVASRFRAVLAFNTSRCVN